MTVTLVRGQMAGHLSGFAPRKQTFSIKYTVRSLIQTDERQARVCLPIFPVKPGLFRRPVK